MTLLDGEIIRPGSFSRTYPVGSNELVRGQSCAPHQTNRVEGCEGRRSHDDIGWLAHLRRCAHRNRRALPPTQRGAHPEEQSRGCTVSGPAAARGRPSLHRSDGRAGGDWIANCFTRAPSRLHGRLGASSQAPGDPEASAALVRVGRLAEATAAAAAAGLAAVVQRVSLSDTRGPARTRRAAPTARERTTIRGGGERPDAA